MTQDSMITKKFYNGQISLYIAGPLHHMYKGTGSPLTLGTGNIPPSTTFPSAPIAVLNIILNFNIIFVSIEFIEFLFHQYSV